MDVLSCSFLDTHTKQVKKGHDISERLSYTKWVGTLNPINTKHLNVIVES